MQPSTLFETRDIYPILTHLSTFPFIKYGKFISKLFDSMPEPIIKDHFILEAFLIIPLCGILKHSWIVMLFRLRLNKCFLIK